jgi:hypothetical protein
MTAADEAFRLAEECCEQFDEESDAHKLARALLEFDALPSALASLASEERT